MSEIRSKALMKAAGLALVVGVATSAGSAPAQAQFFGWFGGQRFSQPGALTSEALVRRLGQQGYRVLKLQKNDSVFLVDVIEPKGRSMRLVVNATDGSILQRFATAVPRYDGRIPGVLDMSPDTGRTNLATPPGTDYPSRRNAPKPPAEARADPNDSPAPSPRSRTSPSRATSLPATEPGATKASDPAPAAVVAEPVVQAPRRSAPVLLAPAPVPADTNKPGYANGVPINPLD